MKRILFFAVGWLGIAMVMTQGAGPRRPPNYSQQNMPVTSFSCRDKILGGYYSDPETDCQMFHVCVKVPGQGIQDYKFLCPNDTAFDQENQICDDWFNIDCEASTLYYSDNFDLYRIGSDFDSGRVSQVAKLPTNNINNAVSETGDDDYLRRADRGESVNNDLLRGSHSSNFFSNKNQGREDEEEIKKKPAQGKSGVRKLLTGKRPVTPTTSSATQPPTQAAPVDPITQRQNLAGRNRAASNYRGTLRSYNNNFKNNFDTNNFDNNYKSQQQVTSPPESQRLNYNTAAPVTQKQQNYYTSSAPVTQRQQNYYSTPAPAAQRQQNYYSTSAPATQKQQNYYTSPTATQKQQIYYTTPPVTQRQQNYFTTFAPVTQKQQNYYTTSAPVTQKQQTYYTTTPRPAYYTSPASSPFSTQNPTTYGGAPSVAPNQNYYTSAPSVAKTNYYTSAPSSNVNQQQQYFNSPTAQQVTGASTTAFDNQKFYNPTQNQYYQTTAEKNYQTFQTTQSPTTYQQQTNYDAVNNNYETAKLFKSIVAAQNNPNHFSNSEDEFLKTAPSQNLGAANFNRVQNIYKFNTTVSSSYSTEVSNSTVKPQSNNFAFTSPTTNYNQNYYSTTPKPFNGQTSNNGTTRNYKLTGQVQNYYPTTVRPASQNYQLTSQPTQKPVQNYYNDGTAQADFTKVSNVQNQAQNQPRGFGKVTSKNGGQKKYNSANLSSQSNYNPGQNYNQEPRGFPQIDKTERPRPFTTTLTPIVEAKETKDKETKDQYDYAYYDDATHTEYDNIDGLEFVKTKTRSQK